MSAHFKETLANMPHRLQSLQSVQVGPYFRNIHLPQLPQYSQLPTTDLQGKASKLHSRNPKVVIVFLVLVLLFFWKNIIYDVGTHFVGEYKPAVEVVVDDKNPIRNSTLGVSLVFTLPACSWLING